MVQLGDKHSFLVTPQVSEQWRTGATTNLGLPAPRGEILNGIVGYILVPGFVGSNEKAISEFADKLHQIIAKIDSLNPCGWIVDLRGNGGGNMWPMLAGIGPVLGTGNVGAFVFPDGHKTLWIYANGQAKSDEYTNAKVSGKPYHLKGSLPPVAVLTDSMTSSSGEAIVIAFKGRPVTRSFGKGTAGLSTSNSRFELNDGAAIFLTTSTFADRTGKIYASVIEPDVIIERKVSGIEISEDSVVGAAMLWLRTQSPCASNTKR